MDGEEQARLAVVLAGPVWIWFVICISQGLEYTMGKTYHNELEGEWSTSNSVGCFGT